MLPRNMPKRAVIWKLNVKILAKLGKINGFSRLPMALIKLLTSCHSDSAQETIESNILTHVQLSMSHRFRDMLLKNLVL